MALGVGLVRVLQEHVVASKGNDLCSGVKVELVECCSLQLAGGSGGVGSFVVSIG